MCLSKDGEIYSFGANHKGQCGHGNTESGNTKLIQSLKQYKVDLIRCGYNLSYCRTVCRKHFIWGQNDDNECLTYEQDGGYQNVFTI